MPQRCEVVSLDASSKLMQMDSFFEKNEIYKPEVPTYWYSSYDYIPSRYYTLTKEYVQRTGLIY